MGSKQNRISYAVLLPAVYVEQKPSIQPLQNEVKQFAENSHDYSNSNIIALSFLKSSKKEVFKKSKNLSFYPLLDIHTFREVSERDLSKIQRETGANGGFSLCGGGTTLPSREKSTNPLLRLQRWPTVAFCGWAVPQGTHGTQNPGIGFLRHLHHVCPFGNTRVFSARKIVKVGFGLPPASPLQGQGCCRRTAGRFACPVVGATGSPYLRSILNLIEELQQRIRMQQYNDSRLQP